MSGEDRPEADREGGLPHPRRVYDLFGQDAALNEAEAAISSGRMHHAWMVSGPKGVGKASFAYRLARRLLGARATDEAGLASDPDDPVCRRLEALSHPDFLLIRRPYNDKTGKLKGEIPVEEARRAPEFFSKSASGKGWRVCIVDSADELNVNSANALLKTLEEPPQRGLLILIVNTPGRLLPTIRSRCRRLILRAPSIEATTQWLMDRHQMSADEAQRAAMLAQGAPGRALALAETDAPALMATIDTALSGLPRLDRAAIAQIAASATRKGGEQIKPITLDFLVADAQNRARALALETGGADRAGAWVEAADRLTRLARESETLYLDPKQTLYAAFGLMQDAAQAD
ncbi:DNA polymerase III, delta prime subunit [Oceanicaulis sp. HTCC2633]|uniref:DNA polymerase III subunit delta' n=1 Tax=Oceanicaulis sp. HTCC2633 TaxID=314254 RepID=UPI000066D4A7|nr:DNA polymerase III subunit delta' [Oceanicaulis sp. HTCC2633]EAP90977.1 DNA polymerase III, delta prime subunit [Oceanicaulis sp. HTCC2633]